jgi:hypothetical protein
MVRRTERVRLAEQYDCAQHLADLEVEFGADVLQRSVVWLTIKESRASFAIEHEAQHVDRVRRFACVMEQRCGQYDQPLLEEAQGKFVLIEKPSFPRMRESRFHPLIRLLTLDLVTTQ